MYLPDDSPDVISNLVNYAYFGKTPEPHTLDIIHFYAYAEKICASTLMDQLMDSIYLCHQEDDILFTLDSVTAIYKNTHETSKLRTFCAARIVVHTFMDKHDGESDGEEVIKGCWKEHPEVFRDVFRVLSKHGREMNARKGYWELFRGVFPRCYFHVHEGAEGKCYTGKEAWIVEREDHDEESESESGGWGEGRKMREVEWRRWRGEASTRRLEIS
jgi:hypothetical protein